MTSEPVIPRTLEQKLKLRTSGIRRSLALLGYEREMGMPLSMGKRLRAWRHGFASASYVLYDLDRNQPDLYLPDIAHLDYDLLEPDRLAINDKLGFFHLMHGVGARSPRLFAFIDRGHLQDFDGSRAGRPLETLSCLVEQVGRLVLRPLGGLGGCGIFFVGRRNGALTVNGELKTGEEASSWFSDLERYVVTEFIEQGDYARAIFASTPNTLRVLTMWDPDRREPFLAAAAHRIGVSGSLGTDSFHSGYGGLSAPIDRDTGVLGIAATFEAQGRLARYANHPDSGNRIEGVQVPGWSGVVDEILRVAKALPQFPYVGWDLLLNESGLHWIEGNSPMGPRVWQVHEPLLKDPRARKAFEDLGMIPAENGS